MSKTKHEQLIEESNKRRKKHQERMRRRMELGYDGWIKRPDGSFYKHKPKGIQNWYDTRTLVEKVTEKMDAWEEIFGERVCHINGKWQLQIRGKHLRRLLKKMPNVKQVGRKLIEEKKC
jgi:hypothetical protein